MINTDILVLGGGAAGLMAAISAKKAAPSARVILAEAQPRCGKKLLATGNGRCNLMNTGADTSCYQGAAAFISPALEAYKAQYEALWEGLGLKLRTDDEGRVYPAANQASAVLDVLRLTLCDLGIEELVSEPVTKLSKTAGVYTTGRIAARKVILATGSRAGKGLGENESYKSLLAPFGHRFTPVYPALTYLTVPSGDIAGLKGIRLKTRISLSVNGTCQAGEEGEILFSDEAVSGIAAMQLSLIAAPLLGGRNRLELVIECCAGDVLNQLKTRRELFRNRTLEDFLTGMTVKRVALLALKRAGLTPLSRRVSSLTGSELVALAKELTAWTLPITGTGSFRDAQVMLGGVSTYEFNPETMESKLAPGLYCCGEMLDVTGKCGGFNLEWAWASGMTAGRKAAESL